jgi:hypothetical protein
MLETEESKAYRRIGVDNSYDLKRKTMNKSIEEISSMKNVQNTKSTVDAAWSLDPK